MGCKWLKCGRKSRTVSSIPPTEPIARPASLQAPPPRPIATVPEILRKTSTTEGEDARAHFDTSEPEGSNTGTAGRLRARMSPKLDQIIEESEHGDTAAEAALIRAELEEAISTALPQSPIAQFPSRKNSVIESPLGTSTSSPATSVISFHTAYEVPSLTEDSPLR